MKKLKIIMLYDDAQGLGHLPFFSYICEQLSSDYDVYILLGSNVNKESFMGAQILELPNRPTTSLYNPIRIKLIEGYIQNIKPDIFLVDYFPFGRFGNIIEINMMISHIHNSGGKAISFMRDIYLGKKILSEVKYNRFVKLLVSKKGFSIKKIVKKELLWLYKIVFYSNIDQIFLVQIFINFCINEKMLDGILIFGDQNIFDMRSEFLLDKKTRASWNHVGYLPGIAGNSIDTIKRGTVLISTGGNVTSKENFISLIKFMSSKTEYNITILIGPYVLQDLKQEIQNIIYDLDHISLSGFTDNFQSFLDNNEFFFGFGGYGTFQHLFNYSGKAHIMANYNLGSFKHRYYEQKYRTKFFEDILNVTFLDNFSDMHLESCLHDYIPQKPNIENIDFCSKQRLIDTVEKIYNQ